MGRHPLEAHAVYPWEPSQSPTSHAPSSARAKYVWNASNQHTANCANQATIGVLVVFIAIHTFASVRPFIIEWKPFNQHWIGHKEGVLTRKERNQAAIIIGKRLCLAPA